jgi:hypothetical protein
MAGLFYLLIPCAGGGECGEGAKSGYLMPDIGHDLFIGGIVSSLWFCAQVAEIVDEGAKLGWLTSNDGQGIFEKAGLCYALVLCAGGGDCG